MWQRHDYLPHQGHTLHRDQKKHMHASSYIAETLRQMCNAILVPGHPGGSRARDRQSTCHLKSRSTLTRNQTHPRRNSRALLIVDCSSLKATCIYSSVLGAGAGTSTVLSLEILFRPKFPSRSRAPGGSRAVSVAGRSFHMNMLKHEPKMGKKRESIGKSYSRLFQEGFSRRSRRPSLTEFPVCWVSETLT